MNLVAKARRGTLLSVGVPLPFSERLSSCSEDAGQASDPLIISDIQDGAQSLATLVLLIPLLPSGATAERVQEVPKHAQSSAC